MRHRRFYGLALTWLAFAAAQGAAWAAPQASATLVDINSASRQQLQTLPGVGAAEAARMVAGRPYLSKAELVTRRVLATGPYLSLKNRIVALQPAAPPRRK